MGSFRPGAGNSIFTGTSISPTLSRQRSNHYAFRAGRNLPDKGISLPLGLVILRPPFTGASIQSFSLALTSPLNLPAPGSVSPYTSPFSVLHRPVFLLNSCLSLFSAATFLVAPSSPEVTGSFCEFLNNASFRRP